MIRMRRDINVAAVPVPICDACADGYHTGCEGGNCACQWTHDWKDEHSPSTEQLEGMNRVKE